MPGGSGTGSAPGLAIPTSLRFLNAGELASATSVFGTSLDYTRILVSNGLGFEGRPFPFGRALRRLGLHGQPIGDRGLAALLSLPLADVDLSHCHIGLEDIRSLCATESPWPRLDLSFNSVSSEGAALLSEWPALERMRHLDLAGCKLDTAAVQRLREASVRSGTLVNLGYNEG